MEGFHISFIVVSFFFFFLFLVCNVMDLMFDFASWLAMGRCNAEMDEFCRSKWLVPSFSCHC